MNFHLFMTVYYSVPFTLDLNGTVSISWFLKNTQVDTRPQRLCLLSSQISHQTLRLKKEVTGAELHTQGFVPVTWNPFQRAEEGSGLTNYPPVLFDLTQRADHVSGTTVLLPWPLTPHSDVHIDKSSLDIMGPRTSRRVSKHKTSFFFKLNRTIRFSQPIKFVITRSKHSL